MTAGNRDDPRLETRYAEEFEGTNGKGTVTLVGVVHDHPASIYRVRRTVETVEPDILAVELPPLAVSLYETYADDDESPPAFGGELSAAIEAAGTDDIVGIDGPSPGFVRELGTWLVRERASRRTVTRSLRSLASITKTALPCRVAAAVTRHSSLRVAVGSGTSHETNLEDPPAEQAADERRQIRTAVSVMDAFETPSSRSRSESRERHMADRLASVRMRGDVVAVVGAGHFDPLCNHIEE
ncbi:hypothetical protein BRC70_08630 [Halobacteriales archaeon QH_6_68_27]|nr:MAG: hypothetical protein BRC70_08630 [Halobacteriales archaeon QH_6_68_27]